MSEVRLAQSRLPINQPQPAPRGNISSQGDKDIERASAWCLGAWHPSGLAWDTQVTQ